MRIAAALSGGVDSAVAAALLAEAGHDVIGVYLRTGTEPGAAARRARQGCCGAADAADAARVADVLDIPFYSLDCEEGFEAIIRAFADDYAAGRTPHPCVLCNRDVKLGRLLRFAEALGAEAVATGHYARVAPSPRHGGPALRVPADARKDQTYVLFPLSSEQLRRTVCPLGEWTKDRVRVAAAERRLPVAEKPESMEICFVPGGDYRAILAERAPEALRPGDVVDVRTGRVAGRHGGIGSVTIGQRRGTGATGPEPLYVTGVDRERNRVLVGPADACLVRTVVVRAWNPGAAARPADGDELPGRAKVRRNHAPQDAVARAQGDDVVVTFREPVRAPAPGQALVLYDDDGWVLGGGWIAEVVS